MNSETTTDHVQKEWWVVHDNDVKRVTGYSCAPANPGMWWIPECGFSGSEDYHLFKTEGVALSKGIQIVEKELNDLEKALRRLKRRKGELRK